MVQQKETVQQPKNTTGFRLARELPEYRKAKLAGRKYVGPMSNISPRWGGVQAVPLAKKPQENRTIKGQTTLTPGGKRVGTDRAVQQKAQPEPTSQTLEPEVKQQGPIQPGQAKRQVSQQAQTIITPDLQQSKQRLKRRREQLERELQEEKQSADHQRVQQEQDQKLGERLEKELKVTRSLVQNLKRQISNLKQEQTSGEQIEKLRQDLSQKQRRSQELRQKIAKLQEKGPGHELREKVKDYEQQVRAIDEQLRKLEELGKQQKRAQRRTRSLQREASTDKQEQASPRRKLEQILQESTQPKPPIEEQNVLQAHEVIETSQEVVGLTETPNAINGVVRDANGSFVGGAIVMIKDQTQHNLRALKTNRIGQFVVTTALPDGTYYVDVSKKGLSFDVVKVSLNGSVPDPIRIQSHEALT